MSMQVNCSPLGYQVSRGLALIDLAFAGIVPGWNDELLSGGYMATQEPLNLDTSHSPTVMKIVPAGWCEPSRITLVFIHYNPRVCDLKSGSVIHQVNGWHFTFEFRARVYTEPELILTETSLTVIRDRFRGSKQ